MPSPINTQTGYTSPSFTKSNNSTQAVNGIKVNAPAYHYGVGGTNKYQNNAIGGGGTINEEVDLYETSSTKANSEVTNENNVEDVSGLIESFNEQINELDKEIEQIENEIREIVKEISVTDECSTLENLIEALSRDQEIVGTTAEVINADILKALNEDTEAKQNLTNILNVYGINYQEGVEYTYGNGALKFEVVDGEFVIKSVDYKKLSTCLSAVKEMFTNEENYLNNKTLVEILNKMDYGEKINELYELQTQKELINQIMPSAITSQYWDNAEVQEFLENNWKQSDGTIPSIYDIYQAQMEQGNALGLDPKLYDLGNYLTEQEIGVYLYIYETQGQQNALDYISLFDNRKKEVDAMKQITEEVETLIDWPEEILDYEESIMNLSNHISENYDEVTMNWEEFIKTTEFQEYLNEILDYQEEYQECITEQAYDIYVSTTTDENIMSMDEWLNSDAGQSFKNSIETITKEELMNSASNNTELINNLLSKETNMTQSYMQLILQDPTQIDLKENIETIIMTKLNGLTDGIISQFDIFSKFTSETSTEDLKNQYYAAIISNSWVLNTTYQVANAEGSMLPSMIMGAGGAGMIGRIWYGLSNFSNELHGGLISGDDWMTASIKGVASAALEVSFETFLGTIPFLSNGTEKINSSFKQSLLSWVGNMAQEGGEEALQTYIMAGFNSIAFGEEFDLATLSEEALQSFIVGALTSAELGAGELINYDTKVDTFTIDGVNYEVKHADLINYLTEKNYSQTGTEIIEFIKEKSESDKNKKTKNKKKTDTEKVSDTSSIETEMKPTEEVAKVEEKKAETTVTNTQTSQTSEFYSEGLRNATEVKNEIIATLGDYKIETTYDVQKIAKKLYVELAKRVHYNYDYQTYKDTDQEKANDIYNSNVSFSNFSEYIICNGWSNLFAELLVEAGIPQENIKIQPPITEANKNKNIHRWVEINLGDGNIIIADATNAIKPYEVGNTAAILEDLANCKLGKETSGYIVVNEEYSGKTPKEIYQIQTQNQQYETFLQEQNQINSQIDNDIKYSTNFANIVENIKKKFYFPSIIEKNLGNERSFEIKIEIVQKMVNNLKDLNLSEKEYKNFYNYYLNDLLNSIFPNTDALEMANLRDLFKIKNVFYQNQETITTTVTEELPKITEELPKITDKLPKIETTEKENYTKDIISLLRDDKIADSMFKHAKEISEMSINEIMKKYNLTQERAEKFNQAFKEILQNKEMMSFFTEATKVAVDPELYNDFFVSYRDHTLFHTAFVAEYATYLAANIPEVDINEIYYAALCHDLGMKGGYYLELSDETGYHYKLISQMENAKEQNGFKIKLESEAARKNHPLNSALAILTTEEIIPNEVDRDIVALLAMSHSKSTSGIKELNNKTHWEECIKRLSSALEQYNKDTKNNYKLDTKKLYDIINNETSFKKLVNEALAIRDGDAMSSQALSSNGEIILQTGGTAKITTTLDRGDDYNIPIEKSSSSEIESIIDIITYEDGSTELVTSEKSKSIHAGESNTNYNSSYDGTNYKCIITLNDANAFPWSTWDGSIKERLGEIETYTNCETRTIILELPIEAQDSEIAKFYNERIEKYKKYKKDIDIKIEFK